MAFIIKMICDIFLSNSCQFFIAFSRLKLMTYLLGLFVKFFYQIRGNFLLSFVIFSWLKLVALLLKLFVAFFIKLVAIFY